MRAILTVCIGNICRSPMAEGLLKAGLPNLYIASAGVGALVGKPADPIARKLMLQRGVDISEHIAQQLNQMLSRRADLILVMDVKQRQYIEVNYPFTRGKVFRIAENLNQDVPDPYKEGEMAFERALSLIDAGSRHWIDRVQKIKNLERQTT